MHVFYSINNSSVNRHFYLMRDTFTSQTVEMASLFCHSPFRCMWTQSYLQYKSVADVFSKVVHIRIWHVKMLGCDVLE